MGLENLCSVLVPPPPIFPTFFRVVCVRQVAPELPVYGVSLGLFFSSVFFLRFVSFTTPRVIPHSRTMYVRLFLPPPTLFREGCFSSLGTFNQISPSYWGVPRTIAFYSWCARKPLSALFLCRPFFLRCHARKRSYCPCGLLAVQLSTVVFVLGSLQFVATAPPQRATNSRASFLIPPSFCLFIVRFPLLLPSLSFGLCSFCPQVRCSFTVIVPFWPPCLDPRIRTSKLPGPSRSGFFG